MSLSCSANIYIQAKPEVVQSVITHLFSPENNQSIQDMEVRPFGLSAVSIDKDQVIRWDFFVEPQGVGSQVEQTLTYVEGQSGGSWLLLKPYAKRQVRKSLENLKQLAESG
jgi:hypothetical protein